MKNILSIALLSFSLLIANSALAQGKKAKKQEDPKKKEQKDTAKPASGTRMAINSAGLPTKGKKNSATNTNNRTVSDPKAEPKKDEKKADEKK